MFFPYVHRGAFCVSLPYHWCLFLENFRDSHSFCSCDQILRLIVNDGFFLEEVCSGTEPPDSRRVFTVRLSNSYFRILPMKVKVLDDLYHSTTKDGQDKFTIIPPSGLHIESNSIDHLYRRKLQ